MPAYRAFLVKFPRRATGWGEDEQQEGSGIIFSNGTDRVLFLRAKCKANQGRFFQLGPEGTDGTPVVPRGDGEYDRPEGPLTVVGEVAFAEKHLRAAFEAPKRLKEIADISGACIVHLG